jgi:hypothetical protein
VRSGAARVLDAPSRGGVRAMLSLHKLQARVTTPDRYLCTRVNCGLFNPRYALPSTHLLRWKCGWATTPQTPAILFLNQNLQCYTSVSNNVATPARRRIHGRGAT